MANPQKNKGDRTELEAAREVTRGTGYNVRRQLGAGRTNAAGGDVGDLAGLPHHVLQVTNRVDIGVVVRSKPLAAERQRQNAGARYAATLVRLPRLKGNEIADCYRVILTFEQWLAYVEAAQFYCSSCLPTDSQEIGEVSK